MALSVGDDAMLDVRLVPAEPIPDVVYDRLQKQEAKARML